jgi:tetratricopeptide (TPR) repeat protein
MIVGCLFAFSFPGSASGNVSFGVAHMDGVTEIRLTGEQFVISSNVPASRVLILEGPVAEGQDSELPAVPAVSVGCGGVERAEWMLLKKGDVWSNRIVFFLTKVYEHQLRKSNGQTVLLLKTEPMRSFNQKQISFGSVPRKAPKSKVSLRRAPTPKAQPARRTVASVTGKPKKRATAPDQQVSALASEPDDPLLARWNRMAGGSTDAVVLKMIKEATEAGSLQEALELLTSFLNTRPDSPLHEEALLFKLTLLGQLGLCNQILSELQGVEFLDETNRQKAELLRLECKVPELDPAHTYSTWLLNFSKQKSLRAESAYRISKILREHGEEQWADSLIVVAAGEPGEWGLRSRFELASRYFSVHDFPRADSLFRRIVLHGKPSCAQVARQIEYSSYHHAECLYQMGMYGKALSAFDTAVTDYPNGHLAPWAVYQMAAIAGYLNKPGRQAELEEKLRRDYPESFVTSFLE